MDLLRDGAVDLEPRRDEHEIGTPAIATVEGIAERTPKRRAS
jgi:hypothetical protein